MRAWRELEFDFEITTVDGDRGRRLAAEQATAILEDLELFQHRLRLPDQPRPEPGNASATHTAEQPTRRHGSAPRRGLGVLTMDVGNSGEFLN